jgi:hypothetical protein
LHFVCLSNREVLNQPVPKKRANDPSTTPFAGRHLRRAEDSFRQLPETATPNDIHLLETFAGLVA